MTPRVEGPLSPGLAGAQLPCQSGAATSPSIAKVIRAPELAGTVLVARGRTQPSTSSPWCPSCFSGTGHGRGPRASPANMQASLCHDRVESGDIRCPEKWMVVPNGPWSHPFWEGGVRQATPAGLTHCNTGVHSSKIPCQHQGYGSAQGVPKPPANGLQDCGQIVPFKLIAESLWSHDLRPCCSLYCPET